MRSGELFIISAPSGAGKTTLVKRLVGSVPDVVFSVSHTTRPRRSGEVEGSDYFFVDRTTFEQMAARGEFLEYAEVFGNLYGTASAAVAELMARGKSVLLDIDWQGARMVREAMPQVRSIFILPPSRGELERRLRDRGQDSDEVIARRMRDAAAEMSHHDEYDYIVVNDDLDSALADLEAIVQNRPARTRSVDVDLRALIAQAS
jgi:guanylate kinase